MKNGYLQFSTRLLAIILISVMALFAISLLNESDSSDAASGTLNDGAITWEMVGTELFITGDGALPDGKSTTPLPECASATRVTIGGNISSIGGHFFRTYNDLTTVVLSENIKTIGERAFYQLPKLECINIPQGVTSIGSYAFYSCTSLTEISLPASVTTIGGYAFHSTSLTEISLPASVETIGTYAFYNCTGLKRIDVDKENTRFFSEEGVLYSVTIRNIDGVRTSEVSLLCCPAGTELKTLNVHEGAVVISAYAAKGCNIEQVLIPASVKSIYTTPFDSCKFLKRIDVDDANTTFDSEDGVLYQGTTLVFCPRGTELKSLIIRDGTTTIASSAAQYCNFKALYIPETVTVFESNSFDYCFYLEKLEIKNPDAVIKSNAFSRCQHLLEAKIAAASIATDAFYLGNSLKTVTLACDTITISDNAFRTCTQLKTVNNLSSLPLVKGSTTYGSIALNAEVINNRAATFVSNGSEVDTIYFESGSSITRPADPELLGHTFQGWYTDENYRYLLDFDAVHTDSITLYAKWVHDTPVFGEPTYIWSKDHSVCTATVECPICYGNKNGHTITETVDSVISITKRATKDEDGNTRYSATFANPLFAKQVYDVPITERPDDNGTINGYAWYLTGNSLFIEMKGNPSSFPDDTDRPWGNEFTALTLDDSVTKITRSMFRGSTKLTTLVISDTMTHIGAYAFTDCTGLETVYLGNGVTSIDPYTFSGCTSLANLYLGDGLKTILGYAFKDCKSLVSVSIPASVTQIDTHVFLSCDKLAAFEVAEDNMNYCAKDGLLYSKDGRTLITCPGAVESVVVPEGVTTLTSSSFFRLLNLKSVYLPDTVTGTDGEDFIYAAFYQCPSLEEIRLSDNIRGISGDAFVGLLSLKTLTLPVNLEMFDCESLYDCFALETLIIDGSNEYFCTVDGILYTKDLGTLVRCPEGKKAVTLQEGLKIINDEAVSGCSMTELVLPDSLTDIGWYAFSNCNNLSKISFGNNLAAVSEDAFTNWVEISPGNYDYPVTKFIGKDGTECNTAEQLKGRSFYRVSDYEMSEYCPHHMTETPAKDADCTAAGTMGYFTCDKCDHIFIDAEGTEETTVAARVIGALGHSMKETESKDATCTEAGTMGYFTCDRCHKIYTDAEGTEETSVEERFLEALGHNMAETIAAKATCTENGTRGYFTCDRCHKVFADANGNTETTVEAQAIQSNGHKWIIHIITPATASDAGAGKQVCDVCGAEGEDVILPKLCDHAKVLVPGTEPSCTANGYRDHYHCETCDVYFVDEEGSEVIPDIRLWMTSGAGLVPAKGHTPVSGVSVPATCTEEGHTAGTYCSVCEEIIIDQEIIPPFGHMMAETSAKAVTCTEAGTLGYFTCDNCHKIFIDYAGHAETTVEARTIKALGHSMKETEPKAATCTEAGTNGYFTCDNCHKVFVDAEGTEETSVAARVIDALGHKMTETVAAKATCTEDGTNGYFACDNCHKVFADEAGTTLTTVEEQILRATGHDIVIDKAVPATKDAPGNTAGSHCSACGEVLVAQEIIPQLPADAQKTEVNASEGSAVMDQGAIQDIIDSGLALEVSSETVAVELPAEVLSTIIDGATGEVKLDLGTVKESELNAEQKKAVEGAAMILSFDLSVGETAVHELGQKVAVTVDFTPEEGKDTGKLYVAYVKDDGSVERIDCQYDNGKLTFATDHFSYYAVMYENATSGGSSGGMCGSTIAAIVVSVLAIMAIPMIRFVRP